MWAGSSRTFPWENTVESSERESFLTADFSTLSGEADTPTRPLAYRQARQGLHRDECKTNLTKKTDTDNLPVYLNN
jgi:hypothetical protein